MNKEISFTQKSTKDLILEAAFSFYVEPRYTDFSMSELAAKVGISKPAIYRHFANKDAVIQAMEKYFCDSIAKKIQEAQSERENLKSKNCEIPFVETINFFLKNPTLINYMMAQLSSKECYMEELEKELINRGVKKADPKDVSEQLFCGITILIFIKARETELKSAKNQKQYSEKLFSEKIMTLILNGLKGTVSKTSPLYPIYISEERKKALDELCKLNSNDFPEENKLFVALATVISKYKMCGVTIEKIAAELNMAKSSLYFYFDNKNQLIKSLIQKELALLITITHENGAEARNLSEFHYISLMTELNFFLLRPSLIPICGWLLQTSVEKPEDDEEVNLTKWETLLPEFLTEPDLGFPLRRKLINFWIGIIPVTLIVIAQHKHLDKKQLTDITKKIFDFVENGIRLNKEI